MLGRLLAGRGALNALFGLYFLVAAASASGPAVLLQAGGYLLADGLMAALVAWLLLQQRQPQRWRVAIEVASAAARVLLGAWFLLVPELAQGALTAVLALAALCAAAVGLGVSEVALALAFGRRSPDLARMLAAALLAVLAGVAMLLAFPDATRLRAVFGVYALAHGLVLLAAGLRGARGMRAAW
jgi:uncharacterized membrane protein HdeD (DUF308 family)